jgi:two-component system chemotaxis sensor kinase CheA
MTREEEFMHRLLSTFRVEADEHIRAISGDLQALQTLPEGTERAARIETVFRAIHSLKGAARAIDLRSVESICQAMETVLAATKKGLIRLSAVVIESLIRGVDKIEDMLTAAPGQDVSGNGELIEELGRIATSASPAESSPTSDGIPETPARASSPPPQESNPTEAHDSAPGSPRLTQAPVPHTPGEGTIRLPAARLDALLLQVEELLSAKLASTQRSEELVSLRAQLAEVKKNSRIISGEQPSLQTLADSLKTRSLRDTRVLASLKRVLECLAQDQSLIETLDVKMAALTKASQEDHRQLNRMVDNLLEDAKKVLMLPFSSLLEPLPRMIRDVCREQGKEADLKVTGGEVEIDKRILEQLKDPLIHLVRNSIDHGLERPTERERLGKPRRGNIHLSIAQVESSKVEIIITDDGRGIDLQKVKLAAVKAGALNQEDASRLAQEDLTRFIFRSGISTSPIITDLSGRGLGLAIVMERVEELGGSVSVSTLVGGGSTFRMVLPLSMATFRGTFVESGGQLFVIPTVNVERVLRLKIGDIATVENRESVVLDGRAVSLARLDRALGLPTAALPQDPTASMPVVVAVSGDRRIAFTIDRVLFEREVLVKNLGRQLTRLRNIAAATVLGTGRVVPILNIRDLLASAISLSGGSSTTAVAKTAGGGETAGATKSILIVEDSITSRMLLKNILESAGYRVTTAVDGQDGLTTLKTASFDLVVSDVQMPRMDGYELTSKIRQDKVLSELPVILVTSLGSREDRERGIEAGASAYIIKTSFDQGNLLETVKRLI